MNRTDSRAFVFSKDPGAKLVRVNASNSKGDYYFEVRSSSGEKLTPPTYSDSMAWSKAAERLGKSRANDVILPV